MPLPSIVSSSIISMRRKKSLGAIQAILCLFLVPLFFSMGNAAAQTVPVTLQAEDFATKTTGGLTADGDAYCLWSNGYIEDSVNFPMSGSHRFIVTAFGSAAAGLWPEMEIRIDQSVIGRVTVNSAAWETYVVEGNIPAGIHRVAIAFTNDYYSPPEDRNLYLDSVSISLSGKKTQITLAWDPSDDPDVAGYNVYRRTAGKAYGKPIGTVENVPNPEFSLNVSYKKKYYIAVTSFDIYGNESSFSNEVSWPIEVFSPAGGEIITSGSRCLIQWYGDSRAEEFELLYSLNKGKSWQPIATLTGSFRSYEWTVPEVLKRKTKCKVKVVLKDENGKRLGSDVSDGVFTISP